MSNLSTAKTMEKMFAGSQSTYAQTLVKVKADGNVSWDWKSDLSARAYDEAQSRN